MKPRLTPKQRFELTKEIDVLSKSPRVKTLTTSEFAEQMMQELGFAVSVSAVESSANSIGLRLTDIFKVGQNGRGRSVFIELYAIESRIKAIEDCIKSIENRIAGL